MNVRTTILAVIAVCLIFGAAAPWLAQHVDGALLVFGMFVFFVLIAAFVKSAP